MDKKNTMLLTVIAVATLLVAVVGATFAYFAISTGDSANTSKTTITGSTENTKVGSVALQGDETLTMNLTAQDMAEANKGNTFYATKEGKATMGSEQRLDIGTATLTGGDSDIKYECKAVYKVTYDDTDKTPDNQVENGNIDWQEEDGAVLKLYGADANVTVSIQDGGYTDEGLKLSDLKEASTGGKTVNVTFKLTGGSVTEAKLQASLAIANSSNDQSKRLADKEFRVSLAAESFNCDTVAGE